ncbi:MAG: hypothetical protein A3F67_05130 [Verrucomicrobia bacterium RIFCSPHIGHO2_12_FULL_41_10]|nr:MAG: hypothetical protein A3F67_05130 [Verrucomicrobia bacterium RIFCSPHIGHO2_12_FULL_41_10]
MRNNVPVIFNINLPVAGVLGSVYIDTNPVTKITMVSRRQDGNVRVAFADGEIDTNFLTVYGNMTFMEQHINGVGMTIYAKSSVNDNALEIVVWR